MLGPAHVVHPRYVPHGAHQGREAGRIRELEGVGVAHPLLAGRFDGGGDDLDSLQGDRLGEVGEQMGAAERFGDQG
ncbi:hypothetical protein GCM10017687_72170 [Streptomyces echinatus]